MFRRVTFLFAILTLVSSMAFGALSGCSNFYCFSYTDEDEYCYQPLPDGGLGDLAGCVTVRQCNGAGECITYCRSSYCYSV